MQANDHFYSAASFERIKSKPKFKPGRWKRPSRPGRETGFSCATCRQHVPCDPEISGVRSRNHCPHCLWSRHMDLHRPGDRLSPCQGRMRPLGLVLKKTNQKYGLQPSGELMLAHVCEGCGKISINRIAADDNALMITKIYVSSLQLIGETIARFTQEGIRLLQAADEKMVQAQLFGNSEKWDGFIHSFELPRDAL